MRLFPFLVRIKREEILDQFTRGRIYEHIRKNPGDHYNSIGKELELNNGVLAYHLKTLERENYIKSERDGMYKRFYLTEMKLSGHVITLNKTQERILGIIIGKPGISQKDIAHKLGLSTPTINYHVNMMVNAGFVRLVRKGKYTMCYQGDGVP